MQQESIEKYISSAKNINFNRGGFSVSSAKDKSIQALSFELNDSLRIGRVKVEAGFEEAGVTTININEIVDEAYIHYLV